MLALRPQSYSPTIPGNTNPPTGSGQSSLWEWYKELRAPEQPGPMQSAVTGLRHTAEGAAVGAILGFVDGELGTLDIQGRYPIDGIAAALTYLLSIRDAGKPDGFASDLRAISQSCTTTFAYRKTKAWRETARGITHITIPRNTDPILAAGKAAGF